jgi:hypothetical protein
MSDFDPVGPKLAKALDPETYHQACDICKNEYIPEINGDLLTCNGCLFRLAFAQHFEIVSNKPFIGKPFPHYFGGIS